MNRSYQVCMNWVNWVLWLCVISRQDRLWDRLKRVLQVL